MLWFTLAAETKFKMDQNTNDSNSWQVDEKKTSERRTACDPHEMLVEVKKTEELKTESYNPY